MSKKAFQANNGGRYVQYYDGDWTPWGRRDNREQCCDCGLVHVSDYRVRKGEIQARYYRDNKATARIRKRNGIAIRKNGSA